jgi:integrase/recombinase XerD
MQVVEVKTQQQQRRYVVIDDEGVLVEPIGQYLKYLDHVGAARNTLRSYATALRLYWQYLMQQELDWQQVTLDHLAQFVVWLKLPSGSLKVLPAQPVPQARSNRTINHTLMVVRGFYDYHWRMEDTPTNIKRQDDHVPSGSCSPLQILSPPYYQRSSNHKEHFEAKGRETATTKNPHQRPGANPP